MRWRLYERQGAARQKPHATQSWSDRYEAATAGMGRRQDAFSLDGHGEDSGGTAPRPRAPADGALAPSVASGWWLVNGGWWLVASVVLGVAAGAVAHGNGACLLEPATALRNPLQKVQRPEQRRAQQQRQQVDIALLRIFPFLAACASSSPCL